MIKSLHIQDFQSHHDTQLELSNRVNVIVGLSNAGKTAIFRGLNWVVNNRPLGDNIIRRGTKQAKVELKVSHNDKIIDITRTKSKSTNEYILSDGQSIIPFTAFGSEPPIEVSNAINLSSINLQGQFHPYFLVFDSPGQVATYIRSITGLEEIDKVCDSISARLRTSQLEAQTCKEGIDKVNTQLDGLLAIDLKSLEMYIEESQRLIDECSTVRDSSVKLSGIINQLKDIERNDIQLPDDIESTISLANDEEKILRELLGRKRSLDGIVDELSSISGKDILIPDDIDGTLSLIEELRNKHDNVESRICQLLHLIDGVNTIDDEMAAIDPQFQKAETERKKLFEQITMCPKCGAKLTEESKKMLILGEI